MSKEQLLEEVLTLSEKEREFVVEGLLLSINHTPVDEIESLWKIEVTERIEKTLNGSIQTFDGEEIINTLRSTLS